MLRQLSHGCLLLSSLVTTLSFKQLLHMCSKDIGLCCFHWRNKLSIDIAFPFGLRNAYLNYQRIADVVCRIYHTEYDKLLVGYIDDFAPCPAGDLSCRGLRPTDNTPTGYIGHTWFIQTKADGIQGFSMFYKEKYQITIFRTLSRT